jgi:hypothetical protein
MGLFDFFKKKENDNLNQNEQNTSNKQEELDDFTNDIINAAEFYVSRTKDRFNGLDYSVKSLEIVDNSLEESAEFYNEMSEEQRQSLINTVGSYIFEVARRNFGGQYFWYDHLNQPIFVTGRPDFEVSILAFEKVKGRLENGKEDYIPFYFEGYTERVQNKQSGMIV